MPKRRSHGEGGLFKRTDGLWVGSVEIYSADGKRRQKRVYSKSRAEAMRKLKELKAKVEGGLVVITGKDTLSDWLDRWLSIRKPHLTQSTYQFYEEAIRLHINPVIGNVRLDRLTAQHLEYAIGEANTTRNAQRVHLVVNMALNTAVKMGVLARNVCAPIPKPAHSKTEQDVLTIGEADKLIRTAEAVDPLMASRWAAAFWTGARPAELRGLEWSRVNLEDGLLDLSWQLKQLKKAHGCGKRHSDGTWPCGKQRVSACPAAFWDLAPGIEYRECRGSLVWTRPKTEAGKRIVPIAPPLKGMLELHRQHTQDQPNPHDLVWHYPDGKPIAPKQEWAMWVSLLDAAGLPRIDQYATRHTTATLLDYLGIPQDVRMQIMGHSSKVAAKAYIHVDQTRTRTAVEKLADAFISTRPVPLNENHH